MITEFVVNAGEKIKRLDTFLVSHERRVSRSSLQRLIVAGRIRVNANVVKSSHKIKPGDRITMDTPEPGPLLLNNEIVSLEVLYEDEALLVVNKPAGVVVHPTSGNWNGTLLNGLLAHLQARGNANRPNHADVFPGLVHRLDKETSGVMVVAKTDHAHRALAKQFEHHTITRTYEAFVWSSPKNHTGIIDLPLGRDSRNTKKFSSNAVHTQKAVSEYHVLQRWGNDAAHVLLYPRTGRPHQLRVHLAALGCPILGDESYGGQKVCQIQETRIPRVMLHARSLGFQHPLLKTIQEYTAEFPSDMQAISQTFQKENIG